MEYFADLHI